MFDKTLQIVVFFLLGTTIFLMGLSAYLHYSNKSLTDTIDDMKVYDVIVDAEHKTEMIEKDFKHINELEKGKSYEEINSDNGTHTITIK